MEFKKRLFLNIGVLLGVCLILTGLLFFFGSNIVKLANQIERLQQELNSKTTMMESLALLRQDSEKASSYLEELESILPNRDQLINFPNDLNMIARQNQINANLGLKEEMKDSIDEPGRIGFTLVLQGPFDNFLGFLETIKNSRYFVKIETIDISRQANNYKALMTGQVFSFN